MRLALSAALSLVALAASAAPALADRTPTYREAEVAAQVYTKTTEVLRSSCVTPANSTCVNRWLWHEYEAVRTLIRSVEAGTPPRCPGYRAFGSAGEAYLARLVVSYALPLRDSSARGSLAARSAFAGAYKRLARCSSFGWAS